MEILARAMRDRFDERKFLFFTVTLMLLLALAISAAGQTDIPNEATLLKWQKAIVKCNYHSQAATTGFIINDNPCIVATAFHLIQDDISFVDGYHIFIKTYDDKVFQAKVVYFKRSPDLLLLQIDYIPEFWFTEYENPTNYQPCIALGLPYDWAIALEARIIPNRRFEVIGIDRVMIAGASGSVVVSRAGKILGMAISVYGYTHITPSLVIKNALEQVRKHE